MRLVARENEQTLVPEGRALSSGSRVRFPMINALLRYMGIWLILNLFDHIINALIHVFHRSRSGCDSRGFFLGSRRGRSFSRRSQIWPLADGLGHGWSVLAQIGVLA